jgi:hypothetical protein
MASRGWTGQIGIIGVGGAAMLDAFGHAAAIVGLHSPLGGLGPADVPDPSKTTMYDHRCDLSVATGPNAETGHRRGRVEAPGGRLQATSRVDYAIAVPAWPPTGADRG